MNYKIKERIQILSDGFPETAALLRDEPNEIDIEKYFRDSFEVFLERLKAFRVASSFTNEEEKQLRFMLEALIAAKQILSEE